MMFPAIFRRLLPKLTKAYEEMGRERLIVLWATAGGRMRNGKGDPVPWIDKFSPPPCDVPSKRECSTMLLRCPGAPPPFLIYGRDAQDSGSLAPSDVP
eukprot:6356215-Amphidinium_carterae.1